MRMDLTAQDTMKLEVILKTDDGKVICHQVVDKNKNNMSGIQHANADQNSLQNKIGIADESKEKSYFSKLMSCCKSKIQNPVTKKENAVTKHRVVMSNLQTKDSNAKQSKGKSCCSKLMCCCKSNESQSSTNEEKIEVPKRANGTASNQTFKIPTQLNDSDATPISRAEVIEDKSAAERTRPKTVLRVDEKGHWPLFDKKPVESTCKMGNCQSQTRVYCEKCELHLCFNVSRNCFYKFHKQNQHIRIERSKQMNKSTKKPSNENRSYKISKSNANGNGKMLNFGDRNKNRFQRPDISKEAAKEKTNTRFAVPLQARTSNG